MTKIVSFNYILIFTGGKDDMTIIKAFNCITGGGWLVIYYLVLWSIEWVMSLNEYSAYYFELGEINISINIDHISLNVSIPY